MRDVILSDVFRTFQEKEMTANEREKLDYVIQQFTQSMPIPAKFCKKLVNTDFYEMRMQVGREVRVIVFSLDNPNINLATKLIFLNGFIKKDTKDYKRQIKIAENILNDLLL